MLSDLPLLGKTVILTGTSKTTEVLQQIKQFGGNALSYPLIETNEIIDLDDGIQLEIARHFDWLIFTSQNAVESFYKKMQRFSLQPQHFSGKIAAVGLKTGKMLHQLGFQVHFLPSTFSADTFVKEFPLIAGEQPKCLFVRGSLAKSTLRDGLPFLIKEWTVYETTEKLDSVEPLIRVIQEHKDVTVIFASPSAVDVFASHIAPKVGWDAIRVASIGHVTSAELAKHGITIHIQPQKYTMQAVLAELVKLEEV